MAGAKKSALCLVGAVDEQSGIMEYITKPKATIALREGSIFFIVSEEKCAKIYSKVEPVTSLLCRGRGTYSERV